MTIQQKRFIRRAFIRELLQAGLHSVYAINTRVRVSELAKYGSFMTIYRRAYKTN